MEDVLRTTHVIQRGTNKPRDWRDGDRIFKYGAATFGIVDRLIIHDAPATQDDEIWLRDWAMTRMAPRAIAEHRYLEGPR